MEVFINDMLIIILQIYPISFPIDFLNKLLASITYLSLYLCCITAFNYAVPGKKIAQYA